MFSLRSSKKVQFCAALSLIVAALHTGQVAAAGVGISSGKIRRELTQKIDQQMLQKLSECIDKSGEVDEGIPYPVRIAEDKVQSGGAANPYTKGRLTVM
ncbi:hypothetical protein MO867_03190 [Microbulbifer sp. OS29]|uniref:Uncharacterized protein n=1 Tax=Microbulbifer okhotskensis TaxID=2926617 RepID=A0A9X2EJE8_9GAMM|nr:hypothetical protein [Microbulbifer okhotskensis]MCO1333337.1 hypothetical protein [Microbulbifer okhotskensis]